MVLPLSFLNPPERWKSILPRICRLPVRFRQFAVAALTLGWFAGPDVHAAGIDTAKTTPREMVVKAEDRLHWAYRPLSRPSPPRTSHMAAARTPVDTFIQDALGKKGLALNKIAGPRTLVRRIYFDLIGLPPAQHEIDRFLLAASTDLQAAVESLVDELLASPHYGERWARHWLDVARYADSDGQESDADRGTAFHYRDFVIRSLNADLPFDRFVRWQIAGDEVEPDNPEALAATGFIVAGPHAVLPDTLMEEERIRTRFNELDDMIVTTGSAMLGLTLGCARCHDHKYDPIPRRDYYRLLSAFNSGDRAELPLLPMEEARLVRDREAAWQKDHAAAKMRLEEWIKNARKPHEETLRRGRIQNLKISDAEKLLLENNPGDERARALSRKFSRELKLENRDFESRFTEQQKTEWQELEAGLKSIAGRKPPVHPTALGFSDFSQVPRETHLLARGDFRSPSEPVALGFLTVLTTGRTPEEFWKTARESGLRKDSTQQRRALAEWLTDLDHGAGPLVARVMVNRIWQHHFGQGLVRTVNDFGTRSDPPTHPELLEWLADEFVRGGWKLKLIHRAIVTSSTYLQETAFDTGKSAVDPENRLLWRKRPQRLEAEILRDTILASSGSLNTTMFGPAVKAPIERDAIQARNMKDPYPADLQDTPSTRRRSIYVFHKRVVQQPLMQAFDGPDATASCGRRENTTVAPQALVLLNDRFVRARAGDFADRIVREAGHELPHQIRHAWGIALGRPPSLQELEASTRFIRSQVQARLNRTSGLTREAGAGTREALTDFCQAIFAMNEFIYID